MTIVLNPSQGTLGSTPDSPTPLGVKIERPTVRCPMNGFRPLAAICAASTVVGAALTVTVAPAANADGTWGAIATQSDGRWAISNGKPDESTARSFAVYKCMGNGPSCRTLITFTDCAALFQGVTGVYYTGTGPTKEDAEAAGQSQYPGAPELTWACNNPPASGATSYRG